MDGTEQAHPRRPSSAYPRALAIVALVLFLIGTALFVLAIVGSDWLEKRARADPAYFAEVTGNGTATLQGPSSWTARYHGPDADQILADIQEPLVLPPLVLTADPAIEGEKSEIAPYQYKPSGEGKFDIAWIHLGRGTHRVTVQYMHHEVPPETAKITFHRWKDPNPLPLFVFVLIAVPCWLLSAVFGSIAGIWMLAIRLLFAHRRTA